MFYLERKLRKFNAGQTYHTWEPLYYCPERWPLDMLRRHLPRQEYRIIEKLNFEPSGQLDLFGGEIGKEDEK